jgi:hypothetical protein
VAEIDPHFADHFKFLLRLLAAADRADPRHDLAHMHRLAHNVVDAGGEKIQRLFQRRRVVERDHRNMAALANHAGKNIAAATIADQKSLDRQQIRFADADDPFLEFVGAKAGRGDALTIETRSIAAFDDFTIVDDDKHPSPQST